METLGNQKVQKSCKIYYCELCDYNTDRKSSYDKHILTPKHIKCSFGNEMETFGNQKLQKSCTKKYSCEKCEKEFINRSGLWKHNKKCITDEKYTNDNELILMLIKQNAELLKENSDFKSSVIDVLKNGTYNNSNNTTTTTNSHNKAFNLNFFLNETCKDAMNIMDFVDSIKLQLTDLERVGEKGFVEGISNIIIQKLKDLDVSKRPVHCTDKKREVLYVKDEDKWEKEDNDNKKVRKAIKHIASKNSKMLNVFREKYPDCIKSTSKYSDTYNKLVLESFGGSGNEDIDNENKIIKKISQEVLVEKG
jgi:hypothetical protein